MDQVSGLVVGADGLLHSGGHQTFTRQYALIEIATGADIQLETKLLDLLLSTVDDNHRYAGVYGRFERSLQGRRIRYRNYQSLHFLIDSRINQSRHRNHVSSLRSVIGHIHPHHFRRVIHTLLYNRPVAIGGFTMSDY